jgi:hypothetical protein
MKKKISEIEKELRDVLQMYLESDLAGDNDDRRRKLSAFGFVFAHIKEKRN